MERREADTSIGDGRRDRIRSAIERAGSNVTVLFPDGGRIAVGAHPEMARVALRSERAIESLARRDVMGLAECYLAADIDIDGDLVEALKVAGAVGARRQPLAEVAWWARLLLPGRRAYNRRSIAFHYDRPAEFFLPWLERWRSYSHGLYASPQEDRVAAQARKLAFALESLGVGPGMEVLDMGAGWGSFVEFAGLRGIRVHAITISREQHRFVTALIRAKGLPCTVELVDFLDYRPLRAFDGAVFMGTLEHVPDYGRVVGFLTRHLKPAARVYADFCAQRRAEIFGAFIRKHVWPGPVTCVVVPRLVRELVRAGFNVHELRDDTLNYAYTVRDWADALEGVRREMATQWGEAAVRSFLLMLRSSQLYFTTNRVQAYRLVAGRTPR